MSNNIVLTVEGQIPSELVGKTYQIHLLPGNRIGLYPVVLAVDTRCPVVVNGERCCEQVNHEGKHWWGSGD